MQQQTAVELLIKDLHRHSWIDEQGYEQVNISAIDIESYKEMEEKTKPTILVNSEGEHILILPNKSEVKIPKELINKVEDKFLFGKFLLEVVEKF